MHDDALTRRDLLRLAACAAATATFPGRVAGDGGRRTRTNPAPIDAARRAAAWIRASRIETAHGIAWPADPSDADSVQRNLYTGTPGVVLFLLELHHATGEAGYLDEALRGARELAAGLPGSGSRAAAAEPDAGLYTGIAGVAFTLAEAARAADDRALRAAAVGATEWLIRNAQPADAGVRWSSVADIISGSAGTALYLLHAASALGVDGATDAAVRAARQLATLGLPERGGLKWRMAESVANLYPNFSHGTAGVAYTLATVGQATGERALIDTALEGAAYLEAVADRTDGCKVFHHEPGGEQLYYLSWCHGPAGTARLHHRLHAATGDAKWQEHVDCAARATTAMGAPERRSDGYWNNISQCCGSAGVGEFFLALHHDMRDPAHLEIARRAARDVMSRATEAGTGLKWIQAEHRVRPELLVAQTGLMQGAAGVGLFLLRLDAAERGRDWFVRLPDTPFG